MALECRVGFVGGGKMTQAMAKGFVSAGVLKPNQLTASARTDATLSKWVEMGATGSRDNCRVVQETDVIFLGVKPHILPGVLEEISTVVTEKHLLISVAAGVPIQFMEEHLPKGSRVIRTIPNTPCLVQNGVVVYALGKCCMPEDATLISTLLQSVGYAEMVPESQIDIVSALCGSSVGWFYMMIEALSDGAVKVGLPRQSATKLAAHSMVGAGKMVLETGMHPGELKDNVTSPGGSTIVGIHNLEQAGIRGALMTAIEATFLKNKDLAPKADK